MVLGIDGWRNGWVAITLDDTGRFASAATAAAIDELLVNLPGAGVIAVDMPLHLADAADRIADREARKFLGPRGNSVFPAPPSFILAGERRHDTHADANAENKARYGKGISAQSFALRTKIIEVNAAHAAGHPVIEVHPEVSFQALNHDRPLACSKKSWHGQHQRRHLLEQAGIKIPADLPDPVNHVPPDDILDAAAAAWSAHRYAHHLARSFPTHPESPDTPAIWF